MGDEFASTGDELAEDNVIWKWIQKACDAPEKGAAAAAANKATFATAAAFSSAL